MLHIEIEQKMPEISKYKHMTGSVNTVNIMLQIKKMFINYPFLVDISITSL